MSALICPSDQWLAAVKEAANKSAEFRQLGKPIDIPVAIIIEPIPPEMGLREAFIFQIDVRQGVIRQMNRISRDVADSLPAAVAGTYRRWKEIFRGQLPVMEALLRGKLRVRGDEFRLARFSSAFREIVRCANRIDCVFLDEVPGASAAPKSEAPA